MTVFLFWFFGAFNFQPPLPQPPRHPSPSRPRENASLLVKLPDYGEFEGTKILKDFKETKVLAEAVDAWLGVEYSTQPVDQDRFTTVTWPKPFEGIRDATVWPAACWQNVYGSFQQTEACLTLNVYRPSGIPMDQKLPALVYLHGGAFVSGSHSSFDGPLFIEKSVEPLMVVTVQYRLGALGSLPAKFMQEAGLLNLGIRDQKMALEFLHKYIEHFGGDPEQITLGGQSAGGHSVGIHLFHNYGEDEGKSLFQRAMLSSGSPTARAFPGVDFSLYRTQVEHFMSQVGCPTTTPANALKCLRLSKIETLQFISSSLFNANNYNITWPWQPVSPGPIFEKRGSKSGNDGTFFKMPILISSTTDEGKAFAPQDFRTDKQYVTFWKTLTPGLNAQDLTDLQTLYPFTEEPEPHSLAFVSPQFERLSAAYGDYSYICPVQETAATLAATGAHVFKARFNTPNWSPAYMGVPHGSDAAYFNGIENTQYPGIAEEYSAYWASFIVSGDPNTHRKPGSPNWERYKFRGGRQLAVNGPDRGIVEMEDESNGLRSDQCNWWNDQTRALRLNK